MVDVTLPNLNAVRQYVTKHAPAYLRSVYLAALADQIEIGLVVPNDDVFKFQSSKPLVITISDDCRPSRGFAGFNQETLKSLFSISGFVAVTTAEPEARFYDQAVSLAMGGKINAVIVETRLSEEARWFEFLQRERPGVMWALWTPEIKGSA